MSYFLSTTSEDSCSGCFEQRFLEEEEEERNVCQERSRYIYPKGAENTKSNNQLITYYITQHLLIVEKFKYIVNLDNQAEFQQKVRREQYHRKFYKRNCEGEGDDVPQSGRVLWPGGTRVGER